MLAFAYVCAFVATLWVPFVVADAARRAPGALERGACVELMGAVDWTLASLLLFNAVNALICVWEIALWVHRENVQRLHEGYMKKFGDKVRGSARETRERVRGTRERETRETRRLTEPNDTDVARAQVLPSPLCLFEDISLSQALSLKYWSIIFAQYASLDPSYVQHTSWSFWIDVGNGFTTLIPTVALSIAVTGFPVVPLIASISPRTLGVVTVVMNNAKYQILELELAIQGVACASKTLTNLGDPRVDFVKLAEGYGVRAFRAETTGSFRRAFSRALEEKGPTLIDAVLSNE